VTREKTNLVQIPGLKQTLVLVVFPQQIITFITHTFRIGAMSKLPVGSINDEANILVVSTTS
jgi:hypothetical protein